MKLIFLIRYWIIKIMVGKSMVIMNAKIDEKGIISNRYGKRNNIIVNNIFYGLRMESIKRPKP